MSVVEAVKACSLCKNERDLSNFQSRSLKAGGTWYSPVCKPCNAERMLRRQREKREAMIRSGDLVSNKPLRKRMQDLEMLYELERRTWPVSDVDTSPGGLGFLAPKSLVAVRMGWVRKDRGEITGDTTTLERALGMRPQAASSKRGKRYGGGEFRTHVPYELAVRLCRAMDADPVDMGV